MLVGVCEDDPSIRRVLRQALRHGEHEVLLAHDGREAVRLFGTDSGVEVVVMDIGLPDSDGRDVVQALQAAGQTAPVIYLTALGAVHDRLSGFSSGGDDYLVKPFDVKELLARVEALARRARPVTIEAPGLVLDPASHSVRHGSAQVLLTPTEFRILGAIASRPGEVVRRRSVVAAAWPEGASVSENTLDSFLRRVRVKLASIDSPVGVRTVRGVGFQLL